MLQVAVLGLPTASVAAGHPIGLPFSVKVTLPPAELPFIVAVSVIDTPAVAGLAELASVVVVDVGCTDPPDANTAAAASTIPAPQSAVVQSLLVPTGNARAVVESFDATCDGVSEGFTDSINEAMPATCGVAMLVPCLPPYA